jgi:hypothetical protein
MTGLALCMFSLVGTQADKLKSLNPPSPVWSRDIIQDLSGFQNVHKRDWHKREFPGIVFLDNSRLIVYETDPTGELASRVNPDVSSSHVLHMSVLDPDSGKVLLVKDWPTRAHGSYILVTSGGVLVRTGEILRLCSRDFMQIREVPLATNSNGYERWEFRVSASRRTVVVQHNTESSTQLDALDGTTFEVRQSWTEPRFYQATFSISDDEMIRMIEPIRPKRQFGVFITKFGRDDWQPVWWRPVAKTCTGAPWFVTNDLVMFGCTEVVLFTKEGEVLMTDHLDKADYPMEDMTSLAVAPAENGKFAAVPVSHMVGIALDMDHVTARYVMVYNLSRRARVLRVGITPLTKVHHTIALSPDGSKLAILNDKQVSVYSVPTD